MRDLIIGIARPMMRLLGRDERGVIGVIIAVMIGCGVLLGIGALVIDLGQIYQNRAELQNGADAAALAVASSCAVGGTCTSGAQLPVAQQYADDNARGTNYHAAVDQVCGVPLGSCTLPVATGSMVVCPSAPSNVNYVDVNVSTLTAGGSPLLAPVFGHFLPGNGGASGANVKACAQAEWGPADQSRTLAVTISICTWDSLTAGGGYPYNPDVAIVIHGKNAGSCKGPAGQTYPGGFDWLCPNTNGSVGASCNNNSSCSTNITLSASGTYYTAQTSTGNRPPPPCNTTIPNDLNTVVYIPVFQGAITPQGHNTEYLIVGLAAFKLTGWANLNTVSPRSNIPSPEPSGCSGNDACIFGEFTQGLVPVSDAVGPPGTGNFGAEAVQLSG